MSARYFIAGIHTGIGKTFLTRLLVSACCAKQIDVRAYKPVISGYDESDDTDTALIAAAQRMDDHDEISPWRFAASLSPHLAAANEGRHVALSELLQWCQSRTGQVQFFEGVGGVMVPLNDEAMVVDWVQSMNMPVILVASSYLGAINHSLLSLELLKQRDVEVKAIVVSQADECVGLEDTCDAIRTFSPCDVPVMALPRLAQPDTSWKDAASLVSLLL